MWKKNYRKIPNHIMRKINQLTENELVVGCVKVFSTEEVREGVLSHLDISIENDVIKFPNSIVPKSSQGKHSKWNTEGRIIKRTDLPMETYYSSFEAPNWGDDYYGTHTVTIEKQRYQRDFVAPRYNEIQIECNNPSVEDDQHVFKFLLNEIIDRNSSDFENRVFDCINVLQENIGACDLVPADADYSDYKGTLDLGWEIFPPGSREETFTRLFRNSNPNQSILDIAEERYSFFETLNPEQILVGTSGLHRYLGAKVRDNLVVFENVKYGNAIYIMFENWEELSQKSRIELLSGERIGFERIVHTSGWKTQVREIIRRKLRS